MENKEQIEEQKREEELQALGLSTEKVEKMIDVAFASRKNSYSPYSKFCVGSAVLTGYLLLSFLSFFLFPPHLISLCRRWANFWGNKC